MASSHSFDWSRPRFTRAGWYTAGRVCRSGASKYVQMHVTDSDTDSLLQGGRQPDVYANLVHLRMFVGDWKG